AFRGYRAGFRTKSVDVTVRTLPDGILAFLYRVVPKVGPLKALAFAPPTAETEHLFAESLERTVARYRALVERAAAGNTRLDDVDLDTGAPVKWRESGITARTCARLLEELSRRDLRELPDGIRADILAYFDGGDGARPPKVGRKEWRETLARVEDLR